MSKNGRATAAAVRFSLDAAMIVKSCYQLAIVTTETMYTASHNHRAMRCALTFRGYYRHNGFLHRP